tara:strand:+ start:645 stop:893 length:249 start_codon:yes stop_codon:yes gene_type:complete
MKYLIPKGGYTMFEILFALLFLFIVLKVNLALGFGILRIAIGLIGAFVVLAILPLSFALFLPLAVVMLVGVGLIAVLKAILH